MSKETQEIKKLLSLDGFANRLQAKDDHALIRKFHQYPFLSLILDLITLTVFLSSYLALSLQNSSDFPYLFVALVALGCLSIIVFQRVYPPYYKKAIARAMMKKHKTKDDTQTNEFFYYYRQEYRILGKIKKSPFELFCKILGIIVKLINFCLNLLTALIALTFALLFGILFGGGLWLLHLFGGGSSVLLQLSRDCFVPAKWAFAFLIRVLSLKDYFAMEGNFSNQSFGNTSKPTGVDREMSDTHLRDYIKISDCVLPGSLQWHAPPSVSVFHTLIHVKGTLAADSISHKTQAELSESLDRAGKHIEDHIAKQVEKFHQDYPNSSTIDIKVELDGYIG